MNLEFSAILASVISATGFVLMVAVIYAIRAWINKMEEGKQRDYITDLVMQAQQTLANGMNEEKRAQVVAYGKSSRMVP